MSASPWEALFWASLLLVAHTYLLYPAVLFVAYGVAQLRRDCRYLARGSDRRCRDLSDDELPPVSLVIPAHNEEEGLPAKLANLAELDYPADRLEIVFVSDGSSDRTNPILAQAERPGLRSIEIASRAGKASALNRGVAEASHEVIVFSDASTLFARDAVRKLVRHFGNPQVGVACGTLRFQGNAEFQRTEGVYWRYEKALRVMESRLGATLTASGAIYALRRAAWRPLKADVMIDDFVVPFNARRLGYQGAYAYYLRGEHIDAHAALRMGLVQEVVPHDALLRVADEWCDRVSALPPHAMEMTKPLLRAVADASWDGALALEEFAEPSCFTTEAFAGAVRGMLTGSR